MLLFIVSKNMYIGHIFLVNIIIIFWYYIVFLYCFLYCSNNTFIFNTFLLQAHVKPREFAKRTSNDVTFCVSRKPDAQSCGFFLLLQNIHQSTQSVSYADTLRVKSQSCARLKFISRHNMEILVCFKTAYIRKSQNGRQKTFSLSSKVSFRKISYDE